MLVDLPIMGVGSGGQEVGVAPWIFIHDADKIEGGLMVLFFGIIFSIALPPGNFSADALASNC